VEAGGGDASNRATRKILDSIKRKTAGEEGVPSISHALRAPTIETNLEAFSRSCSAGHQEGKPSRHFLGHANKSLNGYTTSTHPNPQQ